jgi:hypothetical protein
MFNVSRLPVENLLRTLPFLEIIDFSIYDIRRSSFEIFFLNSESTAFISLSVALSVKRGSLKNYEKMSNASFSLSFLIWK